MLLLGEEVGRRGKTMKTMAMANKPWAKSTPALAILAAACLLGSIPWRCHGLSVPSFRRNPVSPSAVHPTVRRAAPRTGLFGTTRPTSTSSSRAEYSALQVSHGDVPARECDVNMENSSSSREVASIPKNNLLHSLNIVATGRRLFFLALSIGLVNFVRSTILQIPKSDKKMFDECPWPFTLFHDPMKFVKDGATHVVVVWAVLCQVYARIDRVRAAVPLGPMP